MVHLLLKSRVDVNSKNFEDMTALDVLEHQRMLDDREITAMLLGVGAMRGAILPNDCLFKRYLRLENGIKIKLPKNVS